MQHVRECFRVHEAMFQCHVKEKAVMPGVIERLSDAMVVTANFG
jgi:3-hydroxymyristoyl/3-hydroxydecanoyl-(acyl carrier protein) dehydratase